MRCATARKTMITTIGGAASDAERSRLASHLEGCPACRLDYERARRLDTALGTLRTDVPVPAGLEDAVVRRIRNLESDRRSLGERLRGWLQTPVLAAAAAAVLVLAVLVSDRRGTQGERPEPIARPTPIEAPPNRLAAARPEPGTPEVRPAAAEPVQVARGTESEPPSEAPPGLTASLPLLLEMPILRNMEKLENYDRIEAVTLADDEETSG